MKALPVVAGALVLGFALLLIWPSLRLTRTHVHRSAAGEAEFTLEVPRSWTVMAYDAVSRSVTLEGPLPSGGLGLLTLQSFYVPPQKGLLDLPVTETAPDGISREAWDEEGWNRRLESGPALLDEHSRVLIWQMVGTLQRDEGTFTARASARGLPSEADRALLERCLRSMRWIGK